MYFNINILSLYLIFSIFCFIITHSIKADAPDSFIVSEYNEYTATVIWTTPASINDCDFNKFRIVELDGKDFQSCNNLNSFTNTTCVISSLIPSQSYTFGIYENSGYTFTDVFTTKHIILNTTVEETRLCSDKNSYFFKFSVPDITLHEGSVSVTNCDSCKVSTVKNDSYSFIITIYNIPYTSYQDDEILNLNLTTLLIEDKFKNIATNLVYTHDSFIIDCIPPPSPSEIKFLSTNINKYIALVGDVVTIQFESCLKCYSEIPKVTLLGRMIDIESYDQQFKTIYYGNTTVVREDDEGIISFNISNIVDSAGNSAGFIDTLQDLNFTVYSSFPTIELVSIFSNNTNNNQFAGVNDKVILKINSTIDVSLLTVIINGKQFDIDNPKPTELISIILTENSCNGYIDFNVYAEDKVKKFVNITSTTDDSYVLCGTNMQLNASLTSTNVNPTIGGINDTLSLYFDSFVDLYDVKVTLCGFDVIPIMNFDTSYHYDLFLSENLYNDFAVFSIYVQKGNQDSSYFLYETSDINIGTTRPTLNNINMVSNSALGSDKAAIGDVITVSFTSSHELLYYPMVKICNNTYIAQIKQGAISSVIYEASHTLIENDCASYIIYNITDIFGNPGYEYSGDSLTIDTKRIKSDITINTQLTNTLPLLFDLNFDGDVTDVPVSNNFHLFCTICNIVSIDRTSPSSFQVSVNAQLSGNLQIQLKSNSVFDDFGNGNTESAVSDPIYFDNIPPELICPSFKSVKAPLGKTYIDVSWTLDPVYDNYDGSDCCSPISNIQSGSYFNTSASNYTISYSATDQAGNTAGCSFEIEVYSDCGIISSNTYETHCSDYTSLGECNPICKSPYITHSIILECLPSTSSWYSSGQCVLPQSSGIFISILFDQDFETTCNSNNFISLLSSSLGISASRIEILTVKGTLVEFVILSDPTMQEKSASDAFDFFKIYIASAQSELRMSQCFSSVTSDHFTSGVVKLCDDKEWKASCSVSPDWLSYIYIIVPICVIAVIAVAFLLYIYNKQQKQKLQREQFYMLRNNTVTNVELHSIDFTNAQQSVDDYINRKSIEVDPSQSKDTRGISIA